MTVEVEASALDPEELLTRLRALLSEANPETGALDTSEFWEFVAALGRGRGITTRLHEAGLEKRATVRSSILRETNAHGGRAYHIGLLARLVMDIGGPPERASVLPANFNHGAIAGDLMTMLGGPHGRGEGKPQILTSERKGEGSLRRQARLILVQTVIWRAARDGRTLAEVRES